MLFWYLTIGFATVWAIAVVIEFIWFSGPAKEPEPSSEFISEEMAREVGETAQAGGEHASQVPRAGG